MTDTTSQAANTTDRWYSRAWAALRGAMSSIWPRMSATAHAGAQWLVRVVQSWQFDLVILVLQIVTIAALLGMALKNPPAPAQPTVTAPAADQLQPLEARVSALEAAVAGLQVAAPAPTPAATRKPGASAPATTTAAPAQPFGHTDLDRRLADFQRRVDATPSPTTTLKETAK